eukprot:TRINITY_DN18384_c0_g2_i2.p1 TRINITY_DN18384_c0_g2~~TRINITY_DN18384_c0_g2_i2.p1  ORF type:complete len:448 (-),score=119.08 TRINITY_DN18384_c0_g2_i2:220-1458(-)
MLRSLVGSEMCIRDRVWLGHGGGMRLLDTLVLLGDAQAAVELHEQSAGSYMKAIQLRSKQLVASESLDGVGHGDVDELCAMLCRAGPVMCSVALLAKSGISMLHRAVALQTDRKPRNELLLAVMEATLEECKNDVQGVLQAFPRLSVDVSTKTIDEPEPVSPVGLTATGVMDELMALCQANPGEDSVWEEKHCSESAQVHAQWPSGSKHVLTRAVIMLPGIPANLAIQVLLGHKERVKWDNLFTLIKQLRPGETESNGDQLHFLYFRMKKQMAIAPRDICQCWRVRMAELPAGEQEGASAEMVGDLPEEGNSLATGEVERLEDRIVCTILMTDMEHEDAPKPAGTERVRTLISGYQIVSTDAGKSTRLVSVNQSDVGGHVPVRITNAFAAKAPVEWGKKFGKACLKKKVSVR